MPQSQWTPVRLAALRQLWTDGSTASEIAQVLGAVSRNAVLGKIWRLGLEKRIRAKTQKAGSPTRRPAKPRAPQPTSTPRRPPASPACQMPARIEAPGLVASMTELTRHDCKWPIGDPLSHEFTFCGDHSASGPYCAHHAALSRSVRQPLPLDTDRMVARLSRAGIQRGHRTAA